MTTPGSPHSLWEILWYLTPSSLSDNLNQSAGSCFIFSTQKETSKWKQMSVFYKCQHGKHWWFTCNLFHMKPPHYNWLISSQPCDNMKPACPCISIRWISCHWNHANLCGVRWAVLTADQWHTECASARWLRGRTLTREHFKQSD